MSLYPRIDGQSTSDDTSGTQLTLPAMNIAAGDLLVGFCGWYGNGGNNVASVAEIGGTNVFTMATRTNNNNAYGQMCYRIAAEADTTAEFRMTIGTASTYRFFGVIQFRPDTGETIVYDAGPSAAADSVSPHTSGLISTTGTDEVIVGSIYFAAARTLSVTMVAGSPSDSRYPASGSTTGAIWYKYFASAQTDKTVSASQSGGDVDATINALAFKSVTAQFARPSSDIADGNWVNELSSNVNLFQSINETSVLENGDADYIRSASSPSDDTCTVGLSSISTPNPGTVTMRIRGRFL